MANQRTAPLYKQTLKFFDQLISLSTDGVPIEPYVSERTDTSAVGPKLQDECGRFRVWAENTGAHRTGRVSLDHRLREATRVKTAVVGLLENLRAALQEAINILSNRADSPTSDVGSWDSDSSISPVEGDGTPPTEPNESPAEMKPGTELEECLIDIPHFITCLYRLSVATQNPTPRDRLEKCAEIDVSHYEAFDIQHLTEKFVMAPEHKFLIERLGKANTKRRQLLKYHEKHHAKIVGYTRYGAMERYLWGVTSEVPATTATSGFAITDTTVSTYIPRNDSENVDTDMIDVRSESGLLNSSRADSDFTQTSYASSAGTTGNYRVPNPPVEYGMHFQCPYCFTLTIAENRLSWVRHVFRDLRVYVCTFNDCKRSEYLFASRHEWFQHERAEHRRQWLCNACSNTFALKEKFLQHLHDMHPEDLLGTELEILIERSERSIETEQPCPLCKESYSPLRLRSHLGEHMQQIALFVLPDSAEEDDQIKDGDGSSDDNDSEFPQEHSLASEGRDAADETLHDDTDMDDKLFQISNSPDSEHGDAFNGKLYEAMRDHDVEEVRRLLASGIDPNSPGPDGVYPIHLAAYSGDTRVLRLLLGSGVDIQPKTDNGLTTLHIAAQCGHEATVRLLLVHGADIQTKASGGETALHLASQGGHEATVGLLLDRGANIQTMNNDGETALHLATQGGHETIVQLLSERVPNIQAKPEIPTMWESYFSPSGYSTQNATFDWDQWVRNHITSKKWNPEWVPTDFTTAGAAAKAMYDKLAGAIDQDDDTGLGCPSEIAMGLSLLSLYDLVLLVDDSASMTFKERIDPNDKSDDAATRARQDTLLQVLELVCKTYECTRPEGIISVKFFNARRGWGNVNKEKFDHKKEPKYKCQGVTRIGTELKRKIIDQYVFKRDEKDKSKIEKMHKPLLAIIITDGKVEGESEGLLEHVVINCVKDCSQDPDRGVHAVSFQFAQVGRGREAAVFLRKLATDSRVGSYLDCVLNTSLDFVWDDDLKWGVMAQLLLGAITDNWSSRNAPVLWKDQPSKADLTGSNAINNTTTSE